MTQISSQFGSPAPHRADCASVERRRTSRATAPRSTRHRAALGPGLVSWILESHGAPAGTAEPRFAVGYEIEVVIDGEASHEIVGCAEVSVADGAAAVRNPGALYRMQATTERRAGVRVGFALYPDELPGLSSASDLRFRAAAIADPQLTELARAVHAGASDGASPSYAEVARALASFLVRSCDRVRIDRLDLVARELHMHFARPLYVAHLAEIAGMSETTLSRAFARRFGVTPIRYRLLRRLAEAARLVSTRQDLAISEIMERVGFEDRAYFFRAFRRHYGRAPAAYASGVRSPSEHPEASAR